MGSYAVLGEKTSEGRIRGRTRSQEPQNQAPKEAETPQADKGAAWPIENGSQGPWAPSAAPRQHGSRADHRQPSLEPRQEVTEKSPVPIN